MGLPLVRFTVGQRSPLVSKNPVASVEINLHPETRRPRVDRMNLPVKCRLPVGRELPQCSLNQGRSMVVVESAECGTETGMMLEEGGEGGSRGGRRTCIGGREPLARGGIAHERSSEAAQIAPRHPCDAKNRFHFRLV